MASLRSQICSVSAAGCAAGSPAAALAHAAQDMGKGALAAAVVLTRSRVALYYVTVLVPYWVLATPAVAFVIGAHAHARARGGTGVAASPPPALTTPHRARCCPSSQARTCTSA